VKRRGNESLHKFLLFIRRKFGKWESSLLTLGFKKGLHLWNYGNFHQQELLNSAQDFGRSQRIGKNPHSPTQPTPEIKRMMKIGKCWKTFPLGRRG